jgi:murein DD-endopeptidase
MSRESAVVDGTHIRVQREPLPVLGPPLHGGPWVAIYGPAWERGHRRVMYAVDGRVRIPGRFAIDWIRLDADARKVRGDEDRVIDWLGYGADVLAVADALVAATRDDVAESERLSAHVSPALQDATGNFVALELSAGRYAFYEHLKPGSIRVARGERVRRGQVIAGLGFTGQSTGPHLHFHIADANSPLGAEGVPYVLEGFKLLGRFESLEELGSMPWLPLGGGGEPQRRGELPAPNAVVVFPGPSGER